MKNNCSISNARCRGRLDLAKSLPVTSAKSGWLIQSNCNRAPVWTTLCVGFDSTWVVVELNLIGLAELLLSCGTPLCEDDPNY